MVRCFLKEKIMRGHETVAMMNKAREMKLVDEGQAEDLRWEAKHLAEMDGLTDAQNGVHTPPAAYEGDRALEQAWQSAHDSITDLEEMADCDGCHNPDGNPCQYHG
jgi:hypothetical protein